MGNPKYPGVAAALGRIQEESGVELRHDGHHAVSADRVGGFGLVEWKLGVGWTIRAFRRWRGRSNHFP